MYNKQVVKIINMNDILTGKTPKTSYECTEADLGFNLKDVAELTEQRNKIVFRIQYSDRTETYDCYNYNSGYDSVDETYYTNLSLYGGIFISIGFDHDENYENVSCRYQFSQIYLPTSANEGYVVKYANGNYWTAIPDYLFVHFTPNNDFTSFTKDANYSVVKSRLQNDRIGGAILYADSTKSTILARTSLINQTNNAITFNFVTIYPRPLILALTLSNTNTITLTEYPLSIATNTGVEESGIS